MTVDQTPAVSRTITPPPFAPWPDADAVAERADEHPRAFDMPQKLRFEPAPSGWPRVFPGL